MADYKLSHTAEEVDDAVGKVKSGAVLPVVELTTTLKTGNGFFTQEESDALSAAYDTNLPIVLRCDVYIQEGFQSENCAVIFFPVYATATGAKVMACNVAGYTIQLVYIPQVGCWGIERVG